MIAKTKFITVVLISIGTLSFAFGGAPQQPKPGASPEWSVGNPSAPVVIEVFSDYQCRRCAAFNTDVKRVQVKYGDKVRVVFRDFPIAQIHQNALLATQAAEAAGMQAKFFEMNDLLYLKAAEWTTSKNPEEQFISYARDLKLDQNRFRIDFSGQRAQERIRLDVERARSLNLPGTPTVVIDGGLSLHEDLANLDAEIEARLNGPKKTNH
jgi:protein-disulfide isomerase